jgi:hypothetical protein
MRISLIVHFLALTRRIILFSPFLVLGIIRQMSPLGMFRVAFEDSLLAAQPFMTVLNPFLVKE